ncbi:MAG: biotin transporter BioY, partial [Deltaproteobacteria bacterium]
MTASSGNLLADNFTEGRSAALDLLWIFSFSLLTALLAQVAIPLPFTPVPLTGQTFAVLLSGAVLGSRRGFLSQLLYLAQGAAGLPVFAGGAFSVAYMLGPTGGYLLSFPLAAGLIGLLVERGAGRRMGRLAAALLLVDMLILALGTSWLMVLFGDPFRKAVMMGIYPFIAGDILKILL